MSKNSESPTQASETDAIRFHALRVAEVEPLTEDSVAVTFDVPDDLRPRFLHIPGQHIVIKAEIDGEEVRRTYSICSPPGTVRIGIKRIPDGVFSNYATTQLAVDDMLDVMAPIGEFTLDPAAVTGGRYVAVVAGSGVTPVLSMVSATLDLQSNAHFTVLYGNRTSQSIMFIEELEGLKDRFPSRLQLFHVLSREPHQVPLFEGRIDGEKIRAMADSLIDVAGIDGWFLCGPLDMVETVQATLTELGVKSDQVHSELFFDQRIETLPSSTQSGNGVGGDEDGLCQVKVTINGRTSELRARPDGPPLLDYARSVRAEVPFACKGGMCATCKAVVSSGEVTMTKNYALTNEELDAGFVLTCQSHPVTDEVHLNFDARG